MSEPLKTKPSKVFVRSEVANFG